ncbi:tricarballylate utilization 4Fe-4S protein TcuB [Roseibium sp. RKSG952]|uniref:tricarballylate utilization 4Fe-4S protein TcuB n=1 Tax=Roseibium sp. RKSG952 TaxID=2529384 RepID=UPI0012BBB684|nr:tricarballylate utilization 4Fe-4S protein TcuB [Roseibium sp. RKSG952]MTH99097.1 tricarballylate utilization 4Fe-4S protein TcuB [Roseibium sp. RKSG952]
MQTDLLEEARRQAQICNACRYCEGYCAVFPALQQERAFSDGTLTQLANLCHNCRGCYYACQYTAPHEFDVNIPKALAEVRQDSWEAFAWPGNIASLFQKSGVLIALATIAGFAILFLVISTFRPSGGQGFYAVLSHSAMVTIFLPAFLYPIVSLWISLRRYWHETGGSRVTLSNLADAFGSAARLKNLSGGHGDGCNFEDEDRYSNARRFAHQAVMYGFLLCFASTCSGTILYYFLDSPGPYPFWSVPKLLGVPGGLLILAGGAELIRLKLKADKGLGAAEVWGGEMGFVLLLLFVALTGLALYLLGGTVALPLLLAVHLGSVLAFFLLTPYTKMAHGFYRLAALVRDAQRKGAS